MENQLLMIPEYSKLMGQWFGFVTGTNKGLALVNFEKREKIKQGVINGRVMFADQDDSNINFYCSIDCQINNNKLDGSLYNFFVYDYQSTSLLSANDFRNKYRNSTIPSKGSLKGQLDVNNNQLSGEWRTDIETTGIFAIQRSNFEKKIEADIEVSNWNGFKESLAKFDSEVDRFIFRGQTTRKRLRTLFHRSERSDIIRYAFEDLPILRHNINAISNYKYANNNIEDYYALLNLAQHHGYPTPCLDWSESPYVASFFAFQDAKQTQPPFVRIFILDAKAWIQNSLAATSILDPRPSITIQKFPALNNPRAIPQQAVSTLSNVDDIEAFIALFELRDNKKYLIRIDLPVSQRNSVMIELQKMGITAASLFPGFDGMCRYLKERYF